MSKKVSGELLPIIGLLILRGAFTAASLSAHAILMDSRVWVENVGSLQTVGIAPQPSPEILVGHAKDLKPSPSRLRWQAKQSPPAAPFF
jgi:hypothetical protein